MAKKVRFILRHCFDIILFSILCIAVYGIHKWSMPQRRGFFCNDESLQYPYRDSTISVSSLVTLTLTIPTLVIVIVEVFQLYDYSHSHYNNKKLATRSCNNGGAEKPSSIIAWSKRFANVYAQVGFYLFGLALTVIATDVTKFSVGRLRPHFFAVCQPQMLDGTNCSHADNQARYITEYICKGATAKNISEHMLHDVALSFPSGHASIFFYAMLYVALYMQLALSLRISRLLKHLLQFLCVLSAWYVSLSRISDYKHHWTDVAAGMLLGAACAITITCFVAHYFRRAYYHSHNNAMDISIEHNGAGRTSSSGMRNIKMPQTTTAVLPAYTFGTMPYLPPPHAHPHQYAGHTYHNYGYVP